MPRPPGEMTESGLMCSSRKRVCEGTLGSNPSLSAIGLVNGRQAAFEAVSRGSNPLARTRRLPKER